jgi:hypothetical protein
MGRIKNLPWAKIVEAVKEEAEASGYLVDFLDQKDSVDQTCYVYYKDDDQSAIYALNDQHRAQLEDTLGALPADTWLDDFWSELNEHYRMTQ